MKISITGSRGFTNYSTFLLKMNEYISTNNIDINKILSGGAKGIDSLAKEYAVSNNIEIQELIPEWSKYGKSAGILRNKDILENADLNLIFWDGVSKGTKFNIDYCKKNNKMFHVFIIKGDDIE